MNLVPKLCTFFVFMLVLYYLGIFDYVPNYSNWDGYDSIINFKDKAIAFHKYRMAAIAGRHGDYHQMPNPNDNSQITCNPNTVQNNARLPLDVYHRHEKHRNMGQIPALYSYNKHTYCTNTDGSQLYLPRWEAAQGFAIMVYADIDVVIATDLGDEQIKTVSNDTI